MTNSRTWALALVATAALAACGGGSDAPTAPVTSSVTIAGTAAKGAALAGAAVSIKCAAGTGTATTASDGTYTVTITGGNLPCALKVEGTEGSVFHSVVAGTGDSGNFAANITPLTEMMVAQIGGAAPGSFFDGFSNSSAVTPAALTAAVDYVRVALAGSADLTGFNPATDALVIGNALDQKIDAVMAALTVAGTTLAEVAETIASNPTAPTVISAPLAPVASDCAWFKGGKYRMINPSETDPKWKAHVLTIDAATTTALDQDGVSIPFTSDGGCQYTVDDAESTTKIMVSSAGVLVAYSQSKTVATDRSIAIGLPEQTLPLAEFAGTWNIAGWGADNAIASPGSVATSEEVTFDASGQMTAVSTCLGLAACTADSGPFPAFSTNATDGGFDLNEAGAPVGRAFLFKTLAGKSAFVFVAADGLQFIVGTRKATLGTLPTVASVSTFGQFSLNGNGTVSALSEDSTSVTAIDATAKTVTRLLASNNRVDTLSYDQPRDGLRHRGLNTCSIAGVASNCAEVVQMPLQGMGITLTMSVGTNPSTAFYQVSVGKPALN
jgi:hypothetical protein